MSSVTKRPLEVLKVQSIEAKRIKTESTENTESIENTQKTVGVADLYEAFKKHGSVKGMEIVKELLQTFPIQPKDKEFNFYLDSNPEVLEFFPMFVLVCHFSPENVKFLRKNIQKFGTQPTLKKHICRYFYHFEFEKFPFDSNSIFETIKLLGPKNETNKKFLEDVICSRRAYTHTGGDTSSSSYCTGVHFTLGQLTYLLQNNFFPKKVRAYYSRGSNLIEKMEEYGHVMKIFPCHYKRPAEVSELLSKNDFHGLMSILETLFTSLGEFHSFWKKDISSKPAQKKEVTCLRSCVEKNFVEVLEQYYQDCILFLKKHIKPTTTNEVAKLLFKIQ